MHNYQGGSSFKNIWLEILGGPQVDIGSLDCLKEVGEKMLFGKISTEQPTNGENQEEVPDELASPVIKLQIHKMVFIRHFSRHILKK